MRFRKMPPLSPLEELERAQGTKRHTLADFERTLVKAMTARDTLTDLDHAILSYFGGHKSVADIDQDRVTTPGVSA